jgi:hypothetical protein
VPGFLLFVKSKIAEMCGIKKTAKLRVFAVRPTKNFPNFV